MTTHSDLHDNESKVCYFLRAEKQKAENVIPEGGFHVKSNGNALHLSTNRAARET